jgi:hypothetical protein
VLTVFLAALLFCLGMAGYLANRATAKLFTYRQPSPKQVLGRAGMSEAQAQWERGVALLDFVGKNTYFSAFKIHQVRVAGLWFRGALACFAALAVLLVVYAAIGPIPA